MKKLFWRLVIDTATDYLFIALLNNTKEIEFCYEKGKRDHSVKLLQEIERILQKHQLMVKDIDEIIVGVGPGSYTGLRIGVVVAKMFGWNNNIKVKTISSLALIASAYEGDKLIVPYIDARRGNAFLGVYKNDGKALKTVVDEQLTNYKLFLESITKPYEEIVFGKPSMKKILSSNLLNTVENIHELSPNYLRLTEAERNKLTSSQ